MGIHSATLAAGLLLSGTASALAVDEAIAVAQAFCSLRTVEGGNALIYLASPRLTEAIAEAMVENARMQEAFPGEKPPLGDGVPWQSHPDISDSCGPGVVVVEGDALIVEVKHDFDENSVPGWIDRLVLVAGEGGVLLVDDLRYGSDGDSDTLRGVLRGIFSQ